MNAQIDPSSLAVGAPGASVAVSFGDDPIRDFIDGRPLGRDFDPTLSRRPFGPVLPRVKVSQVEIAAARAASAPVKPPAGKRRRIPEYLPSERALNRRPYPVIDYVGQEFRTPSTGTAEKLRSHIREKQKSPGRGAGFSVSPEQPRPVSDSVHVRSYHRPSWFSAVGVNKKRKLIEAKGLPSFHNWRFITLTFNRDGFESPLAAYLAGSDAMRRFMDKARKAALWSKDAKWAWKLEFHADGWPHWHLLVGRKSKFKTAQLAEINRLWSFGRCNVERVNEKGFRYNFKYAFKGVPIETDEETTDRESYIPSWFLDYQASKLVTVKWTDEEGIEQKSKESKPVTFSRVRFWQTSRGFYTGRKKPLPEAKPQKTWSVPVTTRVIMDRADSTVQVIARKSCGKYLSSKTVPLAVPLEKFWNLVGFDTVNGGAVGLGVFSYVVPCHRIQTNKLTSWQIQPLLSKNRLRLHHATKLQAKGETLRTC